MTMHFTDDIGNIEEFTVPYTPEELRQAQWKEFETESLALLNMLRERLNAEPLVAELAALNAAAGGTTEEYLVAQEKLNLLIKQAWELKPKFAL